VIDALQEEDADADWLLLRSAAALTAQLFSGRRRVTYWLDGRGQLRERHESQAMLRWEPDEGWLSLLPVDDPRHARIQLYLPVCNAHAGRPITLGHLGQSLDGFIATGSGESCFVTGPANIRHLHRLRALSHAVIVGAGTVAADNPRLTTRLVEGGNPLRVVLDPHRRLGADHTVFRDGAAPTLRVTLRGDAGSPHDDAGIDELVVGGEDGQLDLRELLDALHARGCARILVEGGGVTVSRFLQQGLLDRLQVAVAPLLIGAGRRGLQLPAPAALADCLRLRPAFHRMGDDMLYDCALRTGQSDAPAKPTTSAALAAVE
jgi:riboflavin-specific deaminase-like protein